MYQMNRRFRMILLLVAAVLLPTLSSHAAENLDPAFGAKGVVITDFGVADDEASALTVQPDGKILLAGFSSNSVVKDIAVARYLSDGKLDTSFHTAGYVTFNVGDGNAVARAMAVQEDGKIVIAGTFDNGANEASSEIFLARLTNEGFPDISFGADGKLVLPLEGKTGSAYDLQVTAEGDILVVGTAGDTNGLNAIVARIDPQGVLDGSFGEDGIAIVARDYETAAHSLVLLADNSILLAGYSKPEEVAGLCLFRLKADGTLDESFGTKGEVQVPVEGGEAVVYDMVAQADGRLVIVGSYDNGSYREVLLGRFLASGAADTGFGTGGLVRNDLGSDSVGYGVAIQKDGSILATGFSETNEGKDIILLQYGAQGSEVTASSTTETTETTSTDPTTTALANNQSLTTEETSPTTTKSATTADTADDSLATATYIAESVSVYDDESRALTVLADGRVLAAGYAGNGDDTDFALLRFSAAAVDTLADSVAGAGGITDGNSFIRTTSITNISRNSAMSGGAIDERITLIDELIPLTVTARGVCFGTTRHPVFRAGAAETSTTTPTTPTTTPTTPTTTPTTPTTTPTTPTTTPTTSPAAGSSSILPAASKETAFNYETVLFGQTSDGSGVGTFGSNIVNITPNTVYYVRAYAVLSDETVVYGNELSFETSDACFIATAAYGSVLDKHVVLLRDFRDAYLKDNSLGRSFVALYYRFSPVIADIIGHNEFLKQAVRICLWPWVAFSYIMLHLAIAAKIALLLFGAASAGMVMYSLKTKEKVKETL